MANETVTVKLPVWFDKDLVEHRSKLLELVTAQKGDGWVVTCYDMAKRVATLSHSSGDMPMWIWAGRRGLKVDLAAPQRQPSAVTKTATELERANPGWTMVRFKPFDGYAILVETSDKENQARQVVANALNTDLRDVAVASTPDGGFDLIMPPTYKTATHLDRLNQAVQQDVAGATPGWFVTVDPATLQGHITPGDPPTFPLVIPADMALLGADRDHTAVGHQLGRAGDTTPIPATIPWDASSFMSLYGLPKSGKSVVTIHVIADRLIAAGAELVILDIPDKAGDYLWCRPWVRPGGWGVDSLAHTVAAFGLGFEECKRRATVLLDMGLQKWEDMPDSERFKPLVFVVDEAEALVNTLKIPPGVPSNDPVVAAMKQENLLHVRVFKMLSDVVSQMRFVGAHMIMSSQVGNSATGMPPTIKNKFGHHFLMGAKPSQSALDAAFNRPRDVPLPPVWVSDVEGVSKGVGTAQLEGGGSFVFKSFFAPLDRYVAAIRAAGVPELGGSAPTVEDMARFVPEDILAAMDDGSGDMAPAGGFTPAESATPDMSLLDGKPRPMCPACLQPIRPDGSCGCA